MALSLAPAHLKRYAEVARLFLKFARGPLASELRSDLAREAGDEDVGQGKPEELARDLEAMGPTFIKLGQLLSSRADLLPAPYLEALSRLQDDVEPFSFGQVEEIVVAELGARLSSAFSEFEAAPLAAASLGQVHRARLRDGRPVAVKVQRPGIREQIVEDLATLRELAAFLDKHSAIGAQYGLEGLVEAFGRALIGELDYRREAQNLTRLHRNLESFESLEVPLPIEDYTTERVLTMDYLEGRKVTLLDPLTRIDIDGGSLADELFRAYLHQVVVDGFFHADPHAGNVILTEDGRLGLIDLGMVGRIAPRMRDALFRLIVAIGEGRGDDAAERALAIGEHLEHFDEAESRRRIAEVVGEFDSARLGDFAIGRAVIAVSRAAAETGVRVPAELTMLGKTLWNLDEIGRALDPDFDPAATIRREAPTLLRHRMAQRLTPGHVASALMDVKELAQELPRRVNAVLDVLAKNALRLKVDAFDEVALIEGLQKIANRIAMGVVLAALIVGAAIVMQIPTRWTVLGYPALAMILFAAAALGGIALITSIVTTDRRRRQRKS
jgi:predicted unusual protein kinase regulating ubiquinone biosynthesis (AarF/ABC1/UbiB family)